MAEWDDKVVAEKVFNKLGISASGLKGNFYWQMQMHILFFGWLVCWWVGVCMCFPVCDYVRGGGGSNSCRQYIYSILMFFWHHCCTFLTIDFQFNL